MYGDIIGANRAGNVDKLWTSASPYQMKSKLMNRTIDSGLCIKVPNHLKPQSILQITHVGPITVYDCNFS